MNVETCFMRKGGILLKLSAVAILCVMYYLVYDKQTL